MGNSRLDHASSLGPLEQQKVHVADIHPMPGTHLVTDNSHAKDVSCLCHRGGNQSGGGSWLSVAVGLRSGPWTEELALSDWPVGVCICEAVS